MQPRTVVEVPCILGESARKQNRSRLNQNHPAAMSVLWHTGHRLFVMDSSTDMEESASPEQSGRRRSTPKKAETCNFDYPRHACIMSPLKEQGAHIHCP